jgi:glycosyltransferase involved in cell wall biosynthesis
MFQISVIIPIYNEADSIKELHGEILNSLENKFADFEVIYVNDGSTDSSDSVLKTLNNARIITLNRRYGQTTAMQVGISRCRFEWITFLDGDGQNDPSDIFPLFIKLISGRAHAVCGWRKNRKDKLSKKLISRVATVLKNRLIPDGIHDSGCTLKVMSTKVARTLVLRGELHRFIASQLVLQGFTVDEQVVNHRARKFGQTKYKGGRVFRGVLDMIILRISHFYSQRPIYLFGVWAIYLIFFALLCLSALVIAYFFFQGTLKNIILMAFGISIFSAVQIFLIGLLLELILHLSVRPETPSETVTEDISC